MFPSNPQKRYGSGDTLHQPPVDGASIVLIKFMDSSDTPPVGFKGPDFDSGRPLFGARRGFSRNSAYGYINQCPEFPGGGFSGEADCLLAYPFQVELALWRNMHNIGRRYVEVFRSKKRTTMLLLMKSLSVKGVVCIKGQHLEGLAHLVTGSTTLSTLGS